MLIILLLFLGMPVTVWADTVTGARDKLDDGTVNSDGQCIGTIYIFNGRDNRCRTAGLDTGYTNCCNDGGTIIMQCEASENQLSDNKDKGLCHYIGQYCSRNLGFLGCVQRKKTYCCFNSMLGRILQEQGRPTLKRFGPWGSWGTAESPNCRGFTPEEFQMLDFSKMDLSEWYGHIETQAQQQITNTFQNNVQKYNR